MAKNRERNSAVGYVEGKALVDVFFRETIYPMSPGQC